MANNIPIGKPFLLSQAIASIDGKYGPYNDKDEAIAALGDDGFAVICEGLTVGIIENDKIVEYWFRGGTDKEHLVKKLGEVLVVELKDLQPTDVLPAPSAKCLFTYNGESVYKTQCVHNNSNLTLACCSTIVDNSELQKVYVISNDIIIDIVDESINNVIPSWMKLYIPKYNVQMLESLNDAMSIEIN